MSQTARRVRVAVDAMGGDYAPEEIIKGAVAAARGGEVDIILVGREDVITEGLKKEGAPDGLVRIVHAPEAIIEGEAPVKI